MYVDIEDLVMRAPEEVRRILQQDRLYLSAFCRKYNVELVTFLPNSEDFPPQGLLYFFSDDLGGYSIKGIKESLK